VVEVARDMVGCVLTYNGLAGRIVETEAYHQDEPACHAYGGPTPRSQTLFEDPGFAYVYRSYGIHALLNAVCEPEGSGAAVLIRALEPLTGIDKMVENRQRDRVTDLCSGPGKLTQALGIELDLNGTSLIDGPIAIHEASEPVEQIAITTGPRIGITKAVDLPWRFYAAGVPHVSRG
jgi:DNA-3-methyladenine glycosylase